MCKAREEVDITVETEQSIRKRMLDATFVVLSRTGRKKLQLMEVAAEAGVSRPTVYRHFGSKEGLLEAFALYEQDNFTAGVARATAGLRGPERIDAALQFIVDHQFSHSLAVLVEMEPGHSIAQMKRVLPAMEEGMRHIMIGDDPDVPQRQWCASRYVTTWSAETTAAPFSPSSAMPPVSNRERVEARPTRRRQPASQPMILEPRTSGRSR